MNLTEAAQVLGISARTLRLAAERGEIDATHPLPDGPWVFKPGRSGHRSGCTHGRSDSAPTSRGRDTRRSPRNARFFRPFRLAMNSVVRPTAGSPSPCHGRGRGSVDPEVDGRPVGVSNVGSIGGGASRDATGRRCPAQTTTNAVRQFGQTRAKAIPNSQSPRSRRGRFAERFIAVSCCRSARFSKTNSRWPRSANASARATTRSSSSMHRSWPASMQQINGDEFWRGSGSCW